MSPATRLRRVALEAAALLAGAAYGVRFSPGELRGVLWCIRTLRGLGA